MDKLGLQNQRIIRKLGTQKKMRSTKAAIFRNIKISFWVSLIICALSAGAIYSPKIISYAKGLQSFRLHDVQVVFEGNASFLNKNTILKKINIKKYKSIFQKSLSEIETKISSHPWVSGVVVDRVLPNRLVVKVIEKRPFAILNLKKMYYLDAEAQMIDFVKPGGKLDLPMVTGLENTRFESLSEEDKKSIYKAIAIINKFSNEFKDILVSEINIDRIFGFKVFTDLDSSMINLGRDDLEQKFFRLKQILARENHSSYVKIDLDYKKRAVVRVK